MSHFRWERAELNDDVTEWRLTVRHDLPTRATHRFDELLQDWLDSQADDFDAAVYTTPATTRVVNERFTGQLRVEGRGVLHLDPELLRRDFDAMAKTAYPEGQQQDAAAEDAGRRWLERLQGT